MNNSIGLTQHEYEHIVFMTRCVYYDLPYPTSSGLKKSIELFNGLKMNIFELELYTLVIIAGTNSLRDWITNFKVAFGVTPRQFQTALSYILDHYKDMPIKKPMIIAGHSLGAGIAEYCASFFHEDVLMIGFNGCPVSHLCVNKNPINKIHLVNKHDILNYLTLKMPGKYYMKHIGDTIVLPDKFSLNIIKSHCDFNTFINYKWKN